MGQEYPLEKERQPTLVFLPVKSHGQSLAGYGPQGCKESDTTEHTLTYSYIFMKSSVKIWKIELMLEFLSK